MTFDPLPKPGEFKKLTDNDYHYLNSIKNISLRFKTLMEILELDQQDLCERNRIQQTVLQILKEFYPDCKVLKFGSSVNGYGFKGCDLDLLFLPFPNYCNSNYKEAETIPVPKPHQVSSGKFPREQLLHMNEVSHLKFIQNCLYKRRKLFQRITFIPAKCPILNIDLVNSNIECDLSASNRLVAGNSQLLWLYGEIDNRVRPLIFGLRYWAKSLGFIQKTFLSSYAFTILVIFALQNTEPRVLPSIKDLNQLAGHSCLIDGWETAFTTNIDQIPKSRNPCSVEQLLQHFFDFYWNFDFVNYVVSPYSGKPVSIRTLKTSEDERIKSFKVTSFSIQDTFILSRNISRNASMKTSFKLALVIAKQFVYEKDMKHFFAHDLYQQKMQFLYKDFVESFPQNPIICSVRLNHNICRNLRIKEPQDINIWYEAASKAILDTLQFGLLFDCEVTDKVRWRNKNILRPPKKKAKLSKRPVLDIVGNLELIMQIQCAVNYETWRHRKKVNNVKVSADKLEFPETLEKEKNISLQLLENPEELLTKPPKAWFSCYCYRYPTPQISDIVLVFVCVSAPELEALDGLQTLKPFMSKTVESILCDRTYRH